MENGEEDVECTVADKFLIITVMTFKTVFEDPVNLKLRLYSLVKHASGAFVEHTTDFTS